MQQYWLAFTYVRGVGPVRLRHLRQQFGSIKEAWLADPDALLDFLPPDAVEHHQQLRTTLNPDALLEQVRRLNAWVLTLDDEDYPALLREISDAPAVLYGRGTLLPEDRKALAFVGTRRASVYGKEVTRRLVGAIVENEITIISGLAHGIDAAAHRAALESGGRTIAVLGSGIDIVYPSEHRDLAQEICNAGALITEFPPGTQPERHNFPARNRVISGLSLGVVVVEAPESSGALQTATSAGEQGREVFAVPGNITSPNSAGTNRLIQDGAKLVMEAADILQELNLAQRELETRQVVRTIAPASPLEAQIVTLLETEALHVDDICRQSGLSIQEINAALALMELKGLVLQVAPMTYQSI